MQKTIIKFSALLLIFSILTACSKNQFMDLSGFIYNFNRVSDEEIEFEGVYSYSDNSGVVYEIFFEDDEPDVVMKLISENSRIKQIRIAIAKIDENGNQFTPSVETISNFLKITEISIRAYCGVEKEKAESIIRSFGLYNKESFGKEGELTLNEGEFRFIYYSDSFVCDFMISNNFLHITEPTDKPQSKPAYGNTTNIRGETTPLPTFKR